MKPDTPDTDHQTAEQDSSADMRPVYDPQAVQVEKSGISARDSVRRKRGRNIALALALAGFVALVFIITIVKLGANVLNRPL